MTKFAPQRVHRLRQQVEEQLVEGIVTGRLRNGERLPNEIELSEQFGVSRATVREALGSLAVAGLIEKSPGANGGSFVRELTATRFGQQLAESITLWLQVGSAERGELARVRELLEVPAARDAAISDDKELLVTLDEIIAEQIALDLGDPRMSELDVDFHGAVAGASGNDILFALIRALHTANLPIHHSALDDTTRKGIIDQHLAIVAAIRNQNPDAAETATRLHLDFLGSLKRQDPSRLRGRSFPENGVSENA